MLGRLTRVAAFVFVYFCVGSVLAELAGLVYVWQKGALNQRTLVSVLAVLHGIDPLQPSPEEQKDPEKQREEDTLAALDRLWSHRERNLELRDQSLASQIDQMRYLKKEIEEKKTHYDKLFHGFQEQLKALQAEAQTAGQTKARKMLENLPPDQAKDHILALIRTQGDEGLIDAVGLISSMPIDAGKRILSRFQLNDPEEGDAFNRIMNMMRDGQPITDLIQRTRKQLQPAQEPTNR